MQWRDLERATTVLAPADDKVDSFMPINHGSGFSLTTTVLRFCGSSHDISTGFLYTLAEFHKTGPRGIHI